ncbi:MAG: hypothetical protein PUC15_02835 [Lentisphaeria bacterium]|nr:hypothetical protein [Lentisphaeria bacterium]
MRYSQLLVQAAELAKTDPERAEALLRKAESIALNAYPDDMILCARCWEDYFHDHDNAMRCLLEAECRSSNTSGFLAVAAAHLRFFHNPELAKRCYRKAVEKATDSDDQQRIQDFLSEFAVKRKEIME